MRRRGLQLTVWAAAFLASVCSSFGQETNAGWKARIDAAQGSASNLTALESEIEALWPGQPVGFFQASDRLGAEMWAAAPTNVAVLLDVVRLGKMALEKPCPENVDPISRFRCFEAKGNWTARLAKITNVKAELRTAELTAKSLGEAQSAIIPNYTPIEPEHRNGIPGTRSGEAINDIKDPVAREAYRQMLAERSLAEAKNTLQAWLPKVASKMKTSLYVYCREWFKQDPNAKSHREELGKAAGLTPAETGQLGMDF